MSIQRLWAGGTHGQPPARVRQVAFTNQIALFASASTLPYQAFYLSRDAGYYLPVILANCLFISFYLLSLPLNRRGRFDAARNVVLGTVYVQLSVVTALVSTAPGVPLFYLTAGSSLGLAFVEQRPATGLAHMSASALLLVGCHFGFPPGSTPLTIPDAAGNVMYAASAAGAVFLAGAFSMLFRAEIDGAERALMRSNEQLQQLSAIDPLTDLANRRSLDAHLSRELGRLRRHGGQVAVLMCDVDAFKAFNDGYGHLAGDACLQRVAEALTGVVGRSTDLVARYGGEESVIALGDTDLDGAMHVAGRACAAVRALEMTHAHSTVAPIVTISAGVAMASRETLDAEELLRRADAALYTAKRAGRNRAVAWTAGAGTATV